MEKQEKTVTIPTIDTELKKPTLSLTSKQDSLLSLMVPCSRFATGYDIQVMKASAGQGPDKLYWPTSPVGL